MPSSSSGFLSIFTKSKKTPEQVSDSGNRACWGKCWESNVFAVRLRAGAC